uniref:Uncharacterized protein n=1 Tax=Oryza rufipogon TaxID=4529 RepID=A0A0E0R906_ORYRU
MNQSGTLKITHKARVKFSIGNYVDIVDCDIAPMNACHLLLGRPRQFDLDATHAQVRMQLLALLNVIGTYGNFDGNSSYVSACTIKYDFTMLSETTIKASKVALESEAG